MSSYFEKKMSQEVFYHRSFWVFLSWYGFDFMPPHPKKWVRYFKKSVNACFFISTIALAILIPITATYNFYKERKVLELMPSFFQSGCAMTLCIVLKRKNLSVRKLLEDLNSYRSIKNQKQIKMHPLMVYLLALLVYIVLISVHDMLVIQDLVLLANFLSSDRVVHDVFHFFWEAMYYSVHFYIPTIVGVLYCVFCDRIILVLSQFESRLKCGSQEEDVDFLLLECFAKKYSSFVKIVVSFSDIFSVPMLLATAMYFNSMFRVLASVLITGSFTSYRWLWVEIVNTVVMDAFLTYTICNRANRISTKMIRIKQIFSHIYETILFSKRARYEHLLIFQHMMSKETVVLSAGGVLFFSRKFLGIAFGTLITYGILFIQIQDKWS